MEMQHANWISQAREHWKEHLPKMYARLSRLESLDKALTNAATATAAALKALTDQGMDRQAAWEQTRETYLFPPPEPASEPRSRPTPGFLAHRELMQGLNSFDPNAVD